MPRLRALAFVLCAAISACSDASASRGAGGPDKAPSQGAEAPDPYVDWPLYGLVTGAQLTVRKAPDPTSLTLGWLRRGEIVRMKPGAEKTATCRSGWYQVHPQGYACAGEGISVSDKAPTIADEDRAQAKRDAPMPYQYYLVKDPKVAEYHQLPSRDQQRATREYVDFWLKLEAEGNEKKLKAFLEGKLPNQPARPSVVRRFLDRGFFVAGSSIAVRSRRRFVHTVRGSFIKEQELEPRSGASFHGVELAGGRTLPVVWAVRAGVPQVAKTLPDGMVKLLDAHDKPAIERLTLLDNWKGWARIGGQLVHELTDGTYLRDWYLAVAEKIARPKEVRADEPWVHVDLGEQTLVLYVGDEPKYATLVSSGLSDHATPTGSFRIQRKYVSDTMADIGADAENDRYSIDDVPWTQYFDGAKALHGAFWHGQFGIQRSHGCVNLSPPDAFYVFQHTWPELPMGWHGMSTQKTGFPGTLVLITE